jgi:hypothetical protein
MLLFLILQSNCVDKNVTSIILYILYYILVPKIIPKLELSSPQILTQGHSILRSIGLHRLQIS